MINWTALCKLIDEANKIQQMSTKAIEDDLKNALQHKFPNFSITVHPFGSRFLGTANEKSDLDVYVRCYAEFFERARGFSNFGPLSKIADGICNSQKWIFLKQIASGCPIVVAKHINGTQVDISYINETTYKKDVMIKYMFDIQPIARYMVIYLRQWIEYKYALCQKFPKNVLCLLVIFFLQMNESLPSVQKLQENLKPNTCPWITDFHRYELSKFGMHKIEPNAQSVDAFVTSFFKFYAYFRFDLYVVSPYLGKQIIRSEIDSHMPLAFRQTCDKTFWRGPMVVQDLICLSKNKGYNAGYAVMDFQYFCRRPN